MQILVEIFGQGKDLTIVQMCCRGVVVFFIALLLIRISGRRSFGVHTPLDNIISIVLGAVLSRAIVGASDFLPVIVCCTVIVLLHRMVGWLIAHNRTLGRLVEGDKILLYQNGHFIRDNMSKALVCQEDVLQGVRKSALTEDLGQIDKIYMEKNGEISAIKVSSSH
jgi:uncharacterized membrane protein YcaP (DUF421 family)